MVALTDATREKVFRTIQADTTIPKDQSFVHVSENWHGSANNDEYVSPQKYSEVMLDTVFAVCPKVTPQCVFPCVVPAALTGLMKRCWLVMVGCVAGTSLTKVSPVFPA